MGFQSDNDKLNTSKFAAIFEQAYQPPAWKNQYVSDNPLNIQVLPQRSDNYFLILGDWGKSFEYNDGALPQGAGECQHEVAKKMAAYVRNQTAQGRKLLFIANGEYADVPHAL